MKSKYLLRPQADKDLDEQAFYLARHGSPELGHRFLIAAHETFVLLATQPEIGWQFRSKHPELESLRVFSISGFDRMLVFYLSSPSGIDILRVIHSSRDLTKIVRPDTL